MIGRRFRVNWPAFLLSALTLALLTPTFTRAVPDQQQPSADDPKSLFKQARKHDRKWRFDSAEKLYRQAIQIDPKYSDAKLALAYLLARKHSMREAYDIAFGIAKA